MAPGHVGPGYENLQPPPSPNSSAELVPLPNAGNRSRSTAFYTKENEGGPKNTKCRASSVFLRAPFVLFVCLLLLEPWSL